MPIYLLNNKIPIGDNDSDFVRDFYESPGWNDRMSRTNRGVAYSRQEYLCESETINLHWHNYRYRKSWVKKLVEV